MFNGLSLVTDNIYSIIGAVASVYEVTLCTAKWTETNRWL